MRIPEERFFTASDGTRLFYRYWPSLQGTTKEAVVLFHRGHEHSGRLQHVVDELDMPATAMFAWDARGHGRSVDSAASTSRNGHGPTMGTLVKDVDVFVKHICSEFGLRMEDIALLGQSVGSVLAAAWVHDYAPPIRCMILASPAFSVKLYVPLARPALGLFHQLFGNFHVNSYVKPGALTHDPERIASYKADPLIRRPISVNILLALYSTADRLIEDAAAIQAPTQILISGADFVVHLKPQHEFYRRLGSKVKEVHVFEGFYHDTLGERDRAPAIAKARAFLQKCFSEAPNRASLNAADRAGYTKDEYDRLSKPLPALHPKAWNFGLTRFGMKTGGRLSDGIRLGLETGFDSGSTLDYIYRNKPSGITPLGTLIDWFYLNAIGWRGIRIRKSNIEKLLRGSIAALRASGQPVRIADIAAGHGRYVLEAIEGLAEKPEHILLRDFSELNVTQGRILIQQKGLDAIARFEKGDAFDRGSVASMTPRPTLAVVSGLYELFPENGPIRDSLSGLAEAMDAGGFLIYTGQPWHPQLEMIARTLPSHRNHQPWIMRRRTQVEMDELVESAGFRKVDQLTDEWGIFTVSVAQRKGD
ncbi:MAG: bifunctional alpha/beta hydrolase/class I SAM-dependent methyltransferase [Acidobacteria bacterium]|nr:bifunctional alpha/beta hydrolase/class I SAM-dependent methyltransferase [Acidobacteriota bacterium]